MIISARSAIIVVTIMSEYRSNKASSFPRRILFHKNIRVRLPMLRQFIAYKMQCRGDASLHSEILVSAEMRRRRAAPGGVAKWEDHYFAWHADERESADTQAIVIDWAKARRRSAGRRALS